MICDIILSMQAIKFENVAFQYNGNEETEAVSVLNDFSIEIEEGEFVAVLGANGSGKSTFAKLVNGLLEPKAGKISVLGMDISDKKNLFEIRKNVGMVFQNPDNQQIASIVEDDVAFGPENIGCEREEIGRRIDYALHVTDTEQFRHSQVSRLSGGQKQRVAIAGALALKPKIMIFDESTSMLDPKGRREIMAVAKSLNKENGMTVINITHYMDEAVEADKIVIISGGKALKVGTPEEIFSDREFLQKVGLELPRPTLIAERLKSLGLPLNGLILTKEALDDSLCKLLQKT